MGTIRIETCGSFKTDLFITCAEEGGHVAAVRRAINFLTGRLEEAVKKDVNLILDGCHPPTAPIGEDKT